VGQRRPGILFPGRGISSVTLAAGDAMLRIDIWANSVFQHRSTSQDTMLVACAMIIKNRRYDVGLNAANLVHEQVEDRLG